MGDHQWCSASASQLRVELEATTGLWVELQATIGDHQEHPGPDVDSYRRIGDLLLKFYCVIIKYEIEIEM